MATATRRSTRRVRAQLDRMAHVMFGGLTHEPAVAPGRAPASSSPRRAWSACSSPTPARSSVEVAIKMACSTSARAGGPERTRLLTVRGGYHGDTFGAMAVCDPVGGMHRLFAGVLAEHVFADAPARRLRRAARRGLGRAAARAGRPSTRDELAAVIVEPVVQGAGGMRFHSPALRARCCASSATSTACC